jgi:multidrug efflux system outer membrane protein
MPTSIKSVVLGVLVLPIMFGCAVGTPFQQPQLAMPAQWNGAAEVSAARVANDWWKQFGSAELDRYVAQATQANHDLAAAASRIQQARAAYTVANAARMPSIDLSASRSRGAANSSQGLQIAAVASYEADLWGGQRAQAQGARALVDYAAYDHAALTNVLQADVASYYFQALALKDRVAIARKNLEAAQAVLKLVEVRFEKGANTRLEVSQQRTSVLSIEAQIPLLEQQLRATQGALALLLGRSPQSFAVAGESLAAIVIPAVAPYQPALLLERRADIRKAEAQLASADADVAQARAALYPSLQLSASAIATGVLAPGAGPVSALAATLGQSLFDGGKRRGQVDQSLARRTELVEQYFSAALSAQKDVQDSLDGLSASQSRQSLLAMAAEEARQAYRIANAKYKAGAQDLLTLLDSQRVQLQAEDDRAVANQARFSAVVSVFRALGGGWEGSAIN